jgi:hypothetical protein
MIARHSPVAHAAYHDLLRALLDDAASELRGTPTRVERNGRVYWYDSYRVGSDVRKRYVGEDSPALRARLDRHAALRVDADARRARRARLVRILRAEGFLGLDPGTGGLLGALARAGVFRLGGVVVGTHAFRLYEGELGVRFAFDDAAMTDDLDIASFERLSLALEDAVSPPLTEVLREFAFDPAPSLEPGRVWRWRQARSEALVEFLTPSFRDDEDLRSLPALGVSAQSLHFLNFLIAEPIAAAALHRGGVLLRVPRPERFAIHKLIVSDRRREGADSLKARKDRSQAAFLIRALAEDRPDDLREAHEDARSRGRRWSARLDSALGPAPEIAAMLARL